MNLDQNLNQEPIRALTARSFFIHDDYSLELITTDNRHAYIPATLLEEIFQALQEKELQEKEDDDDASSVSVQSEGISGDSS